MQSRLFRTVLGLVVLWSSAPAMAQTDVTQLQIESCAERVAGANPEFRFRVEVTGTSLDPCVLVPGMVAPGIELMPDGTGNWFYESGPFDSQADMDCEFPSGDYVFEFAIGVTDTVSYSTWTSPSCFPVIGVPVAGITTPVFSWIVPCPVEPGHCHYALQDAAGDYFIDGVSAHCAGFMSEPAPELPEGMYLFWVELTGEEEMTTTTSTGDSYQYIRSVQRSDQREYIVVIQLFKRGDCNADGMFNIADAIFLLSRLFVSGPAGPCDDACDSNDDGRMDISDAVYSLGALFVPGAAQPLAPAVDCGVDPTMDSVGCVSFSPPCP